MKKLKTIVLIYPVIFLLFSIFYLLLFRTPLFSDQTVLFYRGIALLVLSVVIFLIAIAMIYAKFSRTYFESLIAAVLVTSAIHVSLFVVFPVSFERSVTMYFLSALEQSKNATTCGGLTKEEAQKKLINEYIVKNGAVNKRVHEQTVINFMTDNGKCLQLTDRGSNFLDFSEVVKKLYNIQ